MARFGDMVSRHGMGLIFISHDLNLVASFCDTVLIMYAGQVMEVRDACDLERARHPNTRGFMSCLPHLAVMQQGQVMETMTVTRLRENTPTHAYTMQLLRASRGYDRSALEHLEAAAG